MANEIVKYHSNFNQVQLKNFNKKELDLLIAIFHQLKNQDINIVQISFSKLKDLISSSYDENVDIINYLRNVNRKITQLNIPLENEHGFGSIPFFKKFWVDTNKNYIEVSVNEEFKYILNHFSSFTAFELEEFVNFNSIYTKEFFRRMKQFQKSGFWEVSIDKFKELLNIPKTYRTCDINQKVINPILKEINSLLDAQGNLKYNLTIQEKKEGNGVGRPKIVGYRFTFRKNVYKGVTNKQDILLVQALANSYVNQLICLDYNVQEIYKIKNLFYDNGYVVEYENTETLNLITTKFQGPVDRISDLSQFLESGKEMYKFNFEN